MALPIRKQENKYSYSDYLNWGDEISSEIINGNIYDMSPSPTPRHQSVLGEIFTRFSVYLRGKPCKAFVAPFDVRFSENENEENEKIMNVVQPDISIVCDRKKIDKKGCKGSPNLVIEVVSPSTFKKDMKEKLALYEKFGVKEYWIVYPEENLIYVFSLSEDGKYLRPEVFTEEDSIKVGIFEDLEFSLKEVFGE